MLDMYLQRAIKERLKYEEGAPENCFSCAHGRFGDDPYCEDLHGGCHLLLDTLGVFSVRAFGKCKSFTRKGAS